VIASPNSTSQYNDLTAIAAVSSNNIWAVGNSNNGSQTLIEHWNGSRWSIVASSNPGSVGNLLNAVAVVSASNAWTVGEYSSTNYASLSLIENWNGSSWSVVPSPNVITHPTS
jgi:hypothetical protein